MSKAKLKIALLLCFFLSGMGNLQAQLREGTPFLRNYSAQEYGASTQNWSIVQDKRGILYIANNDGVLEYDGVSWNIIPLNNGADTRSLAMGSDGRIYVGAKGEVGYLEADAQGKMQYRSLLDHYPKNAPKFADVWKTYAIGDNIYFGAFDVLMKWDGKHFETWTPPTRFHLSFCARETIYIRDRKKGLLFLNGSELEQAKGGEVYGSDGIYAMLDYGTDEILLMSDSLGLQIYSPTEAALRPFPNRETSDYLRTKDIYNGIRMPNGNYAYASLKDGATIISPDGNIISEIDKEVGMQSSFALCVQTGDSQSLWIGLGSGITHAEVNIPIRQYGASWGLEGKPYSIQRHMGELYAGTVSGVYKLGPREFEPLKSELVQPFALKSLEEQGILLAGAANGVYEIKNKAIKRVDLRTVFTIYALPNNPSDSLQLLLGMRNGLGLLVFHKGKWINGGTLEGITHEVRNIAQDQEGFFWFESPDTGVTRAKYAAGKLQNISHYDSANGLSATANTSIYQLGKKLVFIEGRNIFTFNASLQTFEPYNLWGNRKGTESTAIKGIYPAKNNYVAIKLKQGRREWLELWKSLPNGEYQQDSSIFRRIPSLSSEKQSVYFDQDDTGRQQLWAGSMKALYKMQIASDGNMHPQPKALLRKVSIGDDSTIYYGGLSSTGLASRNEEFSYRQNAVAFRFASPYFENESANTYSYYLEGNDQHWSEWSSKTEANYTNLWNGHYTFRVKAKNVYGVESEEARYSFSILPPWYRHPVALGIYLLLGIGAIWGLIRLNSYRLQQENKKLEGIIEERTSEIRQKKEEIQVQAEVLEQSNLLLNQQKEALEDSYKNLEILSDIGQKITSTLDLSSITDIVYEDLNNLMDAAAFGIGVYNAPKRRLDFSRFIEKGKVIEESFDYLSQKERFAVKCFTQQKPIVIDDVSEATKMDQDNTPTAGGMPLSLIYIPLIVEGQAIGVLTVQSFQRAAYKEWHLSILRTLASYVAIAINNAKSYDIINEKNRHITDSILYAKTIQSAILPSQEELSSIGSDQFILFKPKDIVSGDYYWHSFISSNRHSYHFVAVVDCTGHGVPGAFMSMIGNTLLNEIIDEKHIFETNEVLEQLHQNIKVVLKQEEKSNNDGMDLGLLRLETTTDGSIRYQYTGAKRPLWIIKNGASEIEAIPGDKKSIGGISRKKDTPFTAQEGSLTAGDSLYLSSDGFIDQHNASLKKFGTRQLMGSLLKVSHESMPRQQELLEKALAQHQGSEHQRDDITILGIRI